MSVASVEAVGGGVGGAMPASYTSMSASSAAMVPGPTTASSGTSWWFRLKATTAALVSVRKFPVAPLGIE